MRFDPKLISADDADDLAADLPEELALLGAALSVDAARLAERYPVEPSVAKFDIAKYGVEEHGVAAPGVTAPPASISVRGWRATIKRTAAAITLVAASIALAIYAGGFEFSQHGAPLADQGPVRGLLIGGIVNEASDAPAVLHVVPAGRTDDLLPLRGAFFRELSGPQQEAVLDLLEEDALTQGSVSI